MDCLSQVGGTFQKSLKTRLALESKTESFAEADWNLISEITEIGVGNLALFMGTAYSSSQMGASDSDLKSASASDPKSLLAQFVHFLRAISCGMQYLSEVGYVHKVLTSTNVKLNNNLVCKISGFEYRVTLEETSQLSEERQKVTTKTFHVNKNLNSPSCFL